ncbi:hypothetical protein CN070_30075 [Sinorhizobium meliloti]|nr:hypothetical protein CN070_30075 [Sinorhizobium meliloti]
MRRDIERLPRVSFSPLAGRRCRKADEGRPRVHKELSSLKYAARAATDRLCRGGPWRSRADANRDR